MRKHCCFPLATWPRHNIASPCMHARTLDLPPPGRTHPTDKIESITMDAETAERLRADLDARRAAAADRAANAKATRGPIDSGKGVRVQVRWAHGGTSPPACTITCMCQPRDAARHGCWFAPFGGPLLGQACVRTRGKRLISHAACAPRAGRQGLRLAARRHLPLVRRGASGAGRVHGSGSRRGCVRRVQDGWAGANQGHLEC